MKVRVQYTVEFDTEDRITLGCAWHNRLQMASREDIKIMHENLGHDGVLALLAEGREYVRQYRSEGRLP